MNPYQNALRSIEFLGISMDVLVILMFFFIEGNPYESLSKFIEIHKIPKDFNRFAC